jgi:hypothetical protein
MTITAYPDMTRPQGVIRSQAELISVQPETNGNTGKEVFQESDGR